jgi:hypothetical protein
MNQLTNSKRVQIIASLVEGNSLRATARMSDVPRKLPKTGGQIHGDARPLIDNGDSAASGQACWPGTD